MSSEYQFIIFPITASFFTFLWILSICRMNCNLVMQKNSFCSIIKLTYWLTSTEFTYIFISTICSNSFPLTAKSKIIQKTNAANTFPSRINSTYINEATRTFGYIFRQQYIDSQDEMQSPHYGANFKCRSKTCVAAKNRIFF